MSTNDVPGAKASNRDALALGCWAEHADGSLMFVYSTEGGRVIYSLFDLSVSPAVEWRDAMAQGAFEKMFSWKDGDRDRWTWHDKTPFPWDRVIKQGARDGVRYASADDQISAAERVRRQRELHTGKPVDPLEIGTRFDKLGPTAKKVAKKFRDLIDELMNVKG